MAIDGSSGQPLFFKKFQEGNHSTYNSMDVDYYNGKLYVYGVEYNSSVADRSNWDIFIAMFSLNGDLESYSVLGRSTHDILDGAFFEEALLAENGMYILASMSTTDDHTYQEYMAEFPWGFEGEFVWEGNVGEEEFEVKNYVDEISVSSRNIQALPISLSSEPMDNVLYDTIPGSGLEQYIQSYSLPNINVAYGEWSGKPMETYVEDKMASIKSVFEMEELGKNAYDKLVNTDMSLNSIMDYLREHGKSYSSLVEGEGDIENALYSIREAYDELKGSLIVSVIPPIHFGSETYNRLVEIYGPLLENYPMVSGRLQLLHAIFSST